MKESKPVLINATEDWAPTGARGGECEFGRVSNAKHPFGLFRGCQPCHAPILYRRKLFSVDLKHFYLVAACASEKYTRMQDHSHARKEDEGSERRMIRSYSMPAKMVSVLSAESDTVISARFSELKKTVCPDGQHLPPPTKMVGSRNSTGTILARSRSVGNLERLRTDQEIKSRRGTLLKVVMRKHNISLPYLIDVLQREQTTKLADLWKIIEEDKTLASRDLEMRTELVA
jgi:hypothetical protein